MIYKSTDELIREMRKIHIRWQTLEEVLKILSRGMEPIETYAEINKLAFKSVQELEQITEELYQRT